MNGAMRTVGGASDRGDFDPSDALLDAAPVDAPVGDSSLRPQLVVHQSLPLLVVHHSVPQLVIHQSLPLSVVHQSLPLLVVQQ